MAAFNKFNDFVNALSDKLHNLATDQITVALCATANTPLAANTKLADLTEISYANLSSRNITTGSSGQSGGTYKLVLNDLTLTASGTVAAFQYVVLYNNTSGLKNLIGWYDYGSPLTLLTGASLLIHFDAVNGALQLA